MLIYSFSRGEIFTDSVHTSWERHNKSGWHTLRGIGFKSVCERGIRATIGKEEKTIIRLETKRRAVVRKQFPVAMATRPKTTRGNSKRKQAIMVSMFASFVEKRLLFEYFWTDVMFFFMARVVIFMLHRIVRLYFPRLCVAKLLTRKQREKFVRRNNSRH